MFEDDIRLEIEAADEPSVRSPAGIALATATARTMGVTTTIASP
ncbi:hypothetical protein [Rhizobium sp. YTU87027]